MLTKEQRSAVWSRKLDYEQRLGNISDPIPGEANYAAIVVETETLRNLIKAKIDHCNTELIKDELIPEPDDAGTN